MLELIAYLPKEKIPTRMRKLVKAFYYELSPDSRTLYSGSGADPGCLYERFLRNYREEERWILMDRPIKGEDKVVAVLTNISSEEWEFSLIVSDKEQRKGLGKSLVDGLNSFLSQIGREFIVVKTKKENKHMRNLLKGLGFIINGKVDENGLFTLRKELDQWPSLPVPPATVENMAEYTRRQFGPGVKKAR